VTLDQIEEKHLALGGNIGGTKYGLKQAPIIIPW
jgi:hypothetical protein